MNKTKGTLVHERGRGNMYFGKKLNKTKKPPCFPPIDPISQFHLGFPPPPPLDFSSLELDFGKTSMLPFGLMTKQTKHDETNKPDLYLERGG